MSLHVDIVKRFPAFDLEVCFDAENEVMGLLGASGCGKSLTMRAIAGIERPDEGRIVVNDQVFFDSAAKVNLSPQMRKTALLFQNYMLFPNLTVEDNVAAGISRSISAADRSAIVQRELARFDVQPFAKRYPAQLSGGQQQRVALARMLAADPCILMLDEPFSALDSHLKSILEQNLSSLFDAFDGTIVYVSHDIDEALRFCDSIAVMEHGRIMERAGARELVDNPQSLAGLKLSGVKNTCDVVRVDDCRVYCPDWGITLEAARSVPDDVRAVGVRAFYLEKADAPGPNVFRMRVDRVTESRFEAMVLLSCLDRSSDADVLVESTEAEMRFLHQRLFWRINLLYEGREALPRVGDETLLRIPPEHLYLVDR